MYRNMCNRKEAEKLFKNENERQLSERIKSQNELRKNDPNWDKKRSRNCVEFWIKKGLSIEEAEIQVKKVMNEIHEKTSIKLKSDRKKYATKYPTKIEYYIDKGFNENEANEKISKIQNRFSLEKCIHKYGKEEGKKIWTERQDKWITTMSNKTEEEKLEINRKKITGCAYSPISQRLFWDIYNIVGNDRVKFGELNSEFHLLNEKKEWLAYDYVDILRKKCIEFNGDFWHCNPTSFDTEYLHRIKNKKAKEIWKNDANKISLIEEKGYKILIIWESEYKKNPQQTLEKCIRFINEK